MEVLFLKKKTLEIQHTMDVNNHLDTRNVYYLKAKGEFRSLLLKVVSIFSLTYCVWGIVILA